MDELNDRDWYRLLTSIDRGNCILMLGPGSSLDNSQSPPLTVSQCLAMELSKQLDDRVSDTDSSDFSHVAELFVRQTESHTDLEFEVDRLIKHYQSQTTVIHQNLAKLPFSLCVSTTHDDFMEKALRDAPGKIPQVDYYDFKSQKNTEKESATNNIDDEPISPNQPLLFRLNGDIQDGQSLVMTEIDLLDFLAAVIQSAPPLPSYITRRFSDPNTSFLFLGFDLYQWHLRILLHVLNACDHKQRSLALENSVSLPEAISRKTQVFFNDHYKLQFCGLELEKFTTELSRRYADQYGGIQTAPVPLPENSPTVFLCHCSDDSDRVAILADDLHQKGIDTWLDRHQIRGGDNWNNLIINVLEKQVDYVLVLQTPQMMARSESYYFMEIERALERQKKQADGIRFLVPCHLGKSKPMQRLEHLNYLDLSTPQGLGELIQSIMKDWEKRQRIRNPVKGSKP